MSARLIILLAASTLTSSGCIRKKKTDTMSQAPAFPAPQTAEVFGALSPSPSFLATLPDPLKDLPTGGVWRPIKAEGAPRPCVGGSMATWTGSVFFVWGEAPTGGGNSPCQLKGNFWDPLTDTWSKATDSPLTTSPNLQLRETRLLMIGPDLHVVPTAAPPSIYDPKTNQWRPGPAWLSGLLWSPRVSPEKNDPHGPDGHAQRPQDLISMSEASSTFEAHPYLEGSPSTLTALTVSGLKSADLASGAIKDWPAIPWPNTSASGPSPSQSSSLLLMGRDDQVIIIRSDAADENASAAAPTTLAVLNLQTTPPLWRMGTPPALTDAKGTPQCPVNLGPLTTWAEGRLVLVNRDSPSSEPKSGRTCLTAVDLSSGTVTHSVQITSSQISRRADDSYEYLDLTFVDRVTSGRRVVYRLKRDGGRVSMSDDGGTGFASLGFDEHLLVFDTGTGSLFVTPPIPGSATTETLRLIPTDRGLIAWGGHRPKSDGTDEETGQGWLLEWPL